MKMVKLKILKLKVLRLKVGARACDLETYLRKQVLITCIYKVPTAC